MRVEFFFELYAAQWQGNQVVTGKQLGYVAFYEDKQQQEIGGFTGMTTTGYSWIVSDLNNKILQQGVASFNVNVLTLVNPNGGDMYVKGFSFLDQVAQNYEYQIYESKTNALSYIIRFKAQNVFALFLPMERSKNLRIA